MTNQLQGTAGNSWPERQNPSRPAIEFIKMKTAEAAAGGPDLEALPDPMRRAVIVHRGALVEPWTWLQDHV